MINYSALDYLKIDIANMRGLDQEQFEDRIAWVDRIEDNPDVKLEDYVEHAESPYQFMAAVLAYRDALAGIPTGHMVGLDAAASGIAIMGVVTGCKTTCMNTGLIGSKRKDMYGECTKEMNLILDSDNKFPRKTVKAAQMCHYYGSKQEPKNTFGEDTPELVAFYQAQEIVAPGPTRLMEDLLMSWQPFALDHHWTMPDGFEVVKPVLSKEKSKIEIDELDHAQIQYVYEVNKGEKRGLSVAADATHSVDGFVVREVRRRCNTDHEQLMEARKLLTEQISNCHNYPVQSSTQLELLWKAHGYMSLVGIEQSPALISRLSQEYCLELLALVNQTLEYKAFDCVFIHDEFKCHANHMNRLREVYTGIMAELAESDVIQEIIRQIRNEPDYVLEKLSDDLGDLIREGEYGIS